MRNYLLYRKLAAYALSLLAAIFLTSLLLRLTAHAQQADEIDIIERLHPSHVEHITQEELNTHYSANPTEAFLLAFEVGDALFEVDFSLIDGGGANVGNGELTTRIPRADLKKPGQWASHQPARATGPNGSSCQSCHFQPVADGAGGTSSNVHRDPFHTGDISQMIHRNTPHLHGMGALQRLAEEMTEDLHAQRDAAIASLSLRNTDTVRVELESKGVEFGSITIEKGARRGLSRQEQRPARSGGNMSRPIGRKSADGPNLDSVQFNYSLLEGIDEDLVVKPFQWKGTFPTVRSFNLDAMHNELGVQPREILPDGVDGDGDGWHTESTIGDITAMTLYLAAQPRPTSRVELGEYGLGPAVAPEKIAQIDYGSSVFRSIGCAVCHRPELTIDKPIFSEPSSSSYYRDEIFPGGQDPVALGLDPANPISFNLTTDQPDNRVSDSSGKLIRHIGALESDGSGGAIVRAFGDMKRHDMGPQLAESIDEAGTGASVFLTENLWGIGGTGPYLHDGRATTLSEAILWHGGEAEASRQSFAGLSPDQQTALIAFLENLVLYLP